MREPSPRRDILCRRSASGPRRGVGPRALAAGEPPRAPRGDDDHAREPRCGPRRAIDHARALPDPLLAGGGGGRHHPAPRAPHHRRLSVGAYRGRSARSGRLVALGRSLGVRGPGAAPVMTDQTAQPLHPHARDLDPPATGLSRYPPVERWGDWEEYDPKAWPKRVPRRYSLIPTICFNCEAGCGLLAYVDTQTLKIQKFEGNPEHPGSRGRNCAKGPATLNQVQDPERILYPLKRVGKRGDGKWERVTWDEALDDISGRIRSALVEGRQKEIMYHLGRPGHELVYLQRVFHAWGIDGHNSHTNVCSASARAGYAFWHGMDRPSPDHANARFILLLSSHLETGHYFNPHAQRIIEAKMRGAKVAVIDSRLSNTASMADYWLSPWPGTEAAILLAMARILVAERRYDRAFVEKWTNWEEYLREERPDLPVTFDAFHTALEELYAPYTPEFAAEESGVAAATIVEIARAIGAAGGALASHIWRNAAAVHLGRWQVARAPHPLGGVMRS